jgi:hypothetical protein
MYSTQIYIFPNYIYYFSHSNRICINYLPSYVKFSKNYLMSQLLNMIFIFFLNCVLLFLQ